MLEPRRLAARLAARYVAGELGERGGRNGGLPGALRRGGGPAHASALSHRRRAHAAHAERSGAGARGVRGARRVSRAPSGRRPRACPLAAPPAHPAARSQNRRHVGHAGRRAGGGVPRRTRPPPLPCFAPRAVSTHSKSSTRRTPPRRWKRRWLRHWNAWSRARSRATSWSSSRRRSRSAARRPPAPPWPAATVGWCCRSTAINRPKSRIARWLRASRPRSSSPPTWPKAPSPSRALPRSSIAAWRAWPATRPGPACPRSRFRASARPAPISAPDVPGAPGRAAPFVSIPRRTSCAAPRRTCRRSCAKISRPPPSCCNPWDSTRRNSTGWRPRPPPLSSRRRNCCANSARRAELLARWRATPASTPRPPAGGGAPPRRGARRLRRGRPSQRRGAPARPGAARLALRPAGVAGIRVVALRRAPLPPVRRRGGRPPVARPVTRTRCCSASLPPSPTAWRAAVRAPNCNWPAGLRRSWPPTAP